MTAKLLTAAAATAAMPALVFLGAGTAHAIQDVAENVPGIVIAEFNPQPDPPGPSKGRQSGFDDPASKAENMGPGVKVANMGPGVKVGLGGPDTHLEQLGGPDTRPGH